MGIFDAGTKQPISTSTFFENGMNLRCHRMTGEWFIEKRMFGEWVIRFWSRGEKYKGVKLRSNRIVIRLQNLVEGVVVYIKNIIFAILEMRN